MEITDTEKQLCRMVSEGKTNLQIAGELILSPGTVRNYLSILMEKVKAGNRAELAAWYAAYRGDDLTYVGFNDQEIEEIVAALRTYNTPRARAIALKFNF